MDYSFDYTNNCQETTKIQVRNVTTKRPSEALQFEIVQNRGKRRVFCSFHLPAEQIPIFIKAIQKDEGQPDIIVQTPPQLELGQPEQSS